VSEILEPVCGAWLGVWPRTLGDGTKTTDLAGNLASLESRLGRQFDMVSRYYGWGQLPPDTADEAWRDTGHLLLVDLRARNFAKNTYVKWSDIASGKQDAYLMKVAARMKAYDKKIMFSFNQEPEQELEKGTSIAGTAADYVAAYRHIHDVFTRANATNVVWVWWIMGSLLHKDWYPDLYPGDAYVDWVSFDPYDFNSCKDVRTETPSQSVSPFYNWLTDSGIGSSKPWMLSEFGSHGKARGEWYAGLAAVVKRLPRIKAIVSFNSNPAGCDTRITSSEDNWRGFELLAKDPYFNQKRPY
jgi:beta-mannanase